MNPVRELVYDGDIVLLKVTSSMQIVSCEKMVKENVFSVIAEKLLNDGVCVLDNVLNQQLAEALLVRVQSESQQFQRAGIGRNDDLVQNITVRSDSMQWLDGRDESEKHYLEFMDELKLYLNRRCMLGLFSYEGHFAHYQQGQFYQKHLDAFRGQSNRILSSVYYLNKGWQREQGGEIVLYDENDKELTKLLPVFNRMVIFLSEEFPHEVLSAKKDRFSIAGWFRTNSSQSSRIDPPQ
jgi:SM-20-related protein